ncbi:hypothetical protein [Spongiibacter sp.]|uniref:hypothetical protein n=1 Tax=Spongiibacter sp. TaxID=2024860 RepID=UPI000C36A1E9|nr:hypothetical protein [Spongiibacter sp.]MBU71805.1 hypothetical protein [Spongiibacter sp.]
MKNWITLLFTLALVTACASPGDPTGAEASKRGRVDSKNTQNIADKKQVYIGDFRVSFILRDKDGTTAKNSMFDRRADKGDYAKSFMSARLTGVSEDVFQQITDQAYEDFRQRLAASGYTVLNRSGLEASKAWNKVSKEESPNPPYAKAFDNSTSSKLMKGVLGVGNVDTITFAPSSMEMVKASSAMMFPYQYGVASEEVGKPLVSAHYTVHFAWFGGESDVTMNYLTNEREMSAETTMGQGIQVIPGAAVVFTLDQGGTFSKSGYVSLKDPVVVAGAYGVNEDTTSGATKAVNALSSTLGFFSGKSTSSKEISVKATPAYYKQGVLRALSEANGRLLKELP